MTMKLPEPATKPPVSFTKPPEQTFQPLVSNLPKIPEMKPLPTKPKPQEPLQKSESGEIRNSFQKAILEEMRAFEQELATFKQKSALLKIDIGTAEEKTALKVDCHEMEKFSKDLVEITASQNQEIHDLQSKTLESFEWAEEAKSRDIRNKDPRYLILFF